MTRALVSIDWALYSMHFIESGGVGGLERDVLVEEVWEVRPVCVSRHMAVGLRLCIVSTTVCMQAD